MEDKNKLLNIIEDEMLGLIYEKPKTDFEHIHNEGVSKCCDVLRSFMDDEVLELNEDKFKPTVEFGKDKIKGVKE